MTSVVVYFDLISCARMSRTNIAAGLRSAWALLTQLVPL
jgi:hypothetical protein